MLFAALNHNFIHGTEKHAVFVHKSVHMHISACICQQLFPQIHTVFYICLWMHIDTSNLRCFDKALDSIFIFFPRKKEWETSNLRSFSYYVLAFRVGLVKNELNYTFLHFSYAFFLLHALTPGLTQPQISPLQAGTVSSCHSFLLIITLLLGFFHS